MSNQQYRKEEPEVPTREARLAQARAKLDSVAIAKPSAGEKLDTARKIMFKEAGGHLLDLQIEGMSLVIQEGNTYRREHLEYQQQMRERREGKREIEPWEPKKAPVSAATMVSASRQLEVLRERRARLAEDVEIRLADAFAAVQERSMKPQPPEETRTPAETATPKAVAAPTEGSAPKREDGAATAAA